MLLDGGPTAAYDSHKPGNLIPVSLEGWGGAVSGNPETSSLPPSLTLQSSFLPLGESRSPDLRSTEAYLEAGGQVAAPPAPGSEWAWGLGSELPADCWKTRTLGGWGSREEGGGRR